MHWHISWVHALAAFQSVLLLGTLWRLMAAHLTANPATAGWGKAMAFQY